MSSGRVRISHGDKNNLEKAYYRWAAAFIFVYDITDKSSFLALEKTIQQINELVPQNKFFGILVGNKADLYSKRVFFFQKVFQSFIFIGSGIS